MRHFFFFYFFRLFFYNFHLKGDSKFLKRQNYGSIHKLGKKWELHQDPKIPHAGTSKWTIVSAIISHSHTNLGSQAV